MESPETYNRVSNIANSKASRLLSLLTLAFVIACFGSAVLIYQQQLDPMLGSIISLGFLLTAFFCFKLKGNLTPRCRFCEGELNHVNRDMILSSEYLAMQGIKRGDFYYAPCAWGQKHSPTGWAKISHRATACHHCRISQQGYKPYFEPVEQAELTAIKKP